VLTNRRGRDLRVQATFRVQFHTLDALVMAYTANLSRGGIRLRADQPLDVGSVVRVRIELPDSAPAVEIPCKVVDVSREASTGKYTFGVTFIDPDETAKKRLEWYILNSDAVPGQFGNAAHHCRLDVLVADDEPLQREAVARCFRARGDTVRMVGDGLAALSECLRKPPDLVLSDVQMPRMDGWQLLRMLRGRPALRNVPVVFLTALASERDRLLGYRLGVDDYVSKPHVPSDLLERADRAVVRAAQLTAADSAAAPESLRGDLEQVSLPSLLAFLEMERKTGVLRVGPVTNALLYLLDGRPIRVVSQDLSAPNGAGLLMALLDVATGRFEFVVEPVEGPDEINMTVSRALLEHARVHDEAERDSQAGGDDLDRDPF
jgi:CheY-like chemotaxis protein/Tfp pilus assembly protein PilZ